MLPVDSHMIAKTLHKFYTLTENVNLMRSGALKTVFDLNLQNASVQSRKCFCIICDV